MLGVVGQQCCVRLHAALDCLWDLLWLIFFSDLMAYCDYLLDQQGNPTGHFWATFLVKYDIKSSRRLPEAIIVIINIGKMMSGWFMGDITGVSLFQVSICKTLERGELDHPALQGNKGLLDQKDQKVKRENDKDRGYQRKNENCITPTVNAAERANETRFVISVFIFR